MFIFEVKMFIFVVKMFIFGVNIWFGPFLSSSCFNSTRNSQPVDVRPQFLGGLTSSK
jgi:hypothetical protein